MPDLQGSLLLNDQDMPDPFMPGKIMIAHPGISTLGLMLLDVASL